MLRKRRAQMWLNLGAASGDAKAVLNRDAFAGLMTPQQIAEALQLTRDCALRMLKGCDCVALTSR